MKRLVVVPALNEEKTIRQTLEQVKGYDVVVCDGGSTDSTPSIAKEMGATVLECPSGYGKVILEGFKWGKKYDQFIVLDCESHTFREIVPFLDCGADVIAGHRKGERKPLIRKIITAVGRAMKPAGAETEIVDISNGFRAYSRRFVDYLLRVPDIADAPSYTFNAVVAFYTRDFSVVQFPMTYIGGKTGLTRKELWKAWMWRSKYVMKYPKEPINPTLDDVVAFLKWQSNDFESFVRSRHA